ncbi:MAG: hypothetical protein NVS1B11_35040 [Terriglobales bacterium]
MWFEDLDRQLKELKEEIVVLCQQNNEDNKKNNHNTLRSDRDRRRMRLEQIKAEIALILKSFKGD